MSDNKNIRSFSNSLLNSYLRYLHGYENRGRYRKFLKALGVEERWLNNPNATHDADFRDHFFKVLKESFPEKIEIIFEAVKWQYTEKKYRWFGFLLGLFITPKTFYPRLIQRFKNSNSYNELEFATVYKKTSISRGRFTQRYHHPSMKHLNGCLCEVARGHITGIAAHYGYQLLDLQESMCVKNGSEYCEYEITWVNRPLIPHLVLGGVFHLIAFTIDYGFFHTDIALSIVHSFLYALTAITTYSAFWSRRGMKDILEYQEHTQFEAAILRKSSEILNKNFLQFQQDMHAALSLAAVGEMSFSFLQDRAKLQSIRKALSSGNLETPGNNIQSQSDLCQVTQDCIELFKPFLEKHQIEVRILPVEKNIPIQSYEGYLEMIVLNLIQTAANAMIDSPIRRLTVELSQNSGLATLSVSDSATKSTKSSFSLYSLKKVVDRINGTLDVVSREDGHRYTVILPGLAQPRRELSA